MSRAGGAHAGAAPVARRARAAAVVGLVALLATACGPSSVGGASAETAVVTTQADCLAPEVLDALGLTLDPTLAARASHPPAPAAGRVPDGFAPTSVLVCQVGGQMRDGAGMWTAVTATSREGSAADIAALLAALDSAVASSAGASSSPSCSPGGHRMVLWLLDALDRAVRPTFAVDGCGAPTTALRAALDRLAVTGAVDRPVELLSRTP